MLMNHYYAQNYASIMWTTLLTSENFQMYDRVLNRLIMHCKPLVIDYVMYAFMFS